MPRKKRAIKGKTNTGTHPEGQATNPVDHPTEDQQGSGAGSTNKVSQDRQPQAPVGRQPQAPVGRQPQAPVGRQPQAPVGRQPQAPVGRQPQAPVGRQPQAPVGRQPQAPVGRQPQAPVGRQPQAPVGRQPQAPVGRQPQAPVGRQPQAPVGRQPQAPVGRQPQAPVGRQPQAPVGRQPQAPVGRQPQAPVGRQPQAPVGRQPQAPVGRQPQAPVGRQPQAPVGRQPQAPVGRQPQAPVGRQPQAPVGRQPQAPVGRQPQAPVGRQLEQPEEFPSLEAAARMVNVNKKSRSTNKTPAHFHLNNPRARQDAGREFVSDQSQERGAVVHQHPQLLSATPEKHFYLGSNEEKIKELQSSSSELGLLVKGGGNVAVKHTPTQTKGQNAGVSHKDPTYREDTACSPSHFHQAFAGTSSISKDKSVPSAACHSESQRAAITAIAKRPNFGTAGRQIQLISNYFLLKGKGGYVYRYNVEIKNESPANKNVKLKTIKEAKERGDSLLEIQQKRAVGKQKCRQVMDQVVEKCSFRKCYPFYDGQSSLYTLSPLDIGPIFSKSVAVVDGPCSKTYSVIIKPVNKNGSGNVIDLRSLAQVCVGYSREISYEAIMTLDTLLSHRDPPFNHIAVGRSFFSPKEAGKTQIDGQLEIWKGYNQSVHLTYKGPAVLVNISTKAFHSSGSVISHACKVLGFDVTRQALRAENIQSLSRSLRDVKVQVTHLPYPRKYTVVSVSQKRATEQIVNIDGKDISVADYFSRKYKPLTFSHLPCLEMRSSGRQTYTPMELCEIPAGQPKLGQLNARQASQMITKTAIPPTEKFRGIITYADTICKTSGRYIERSGYKMELKPLNVIGRVISPPELAYKNEPSVKPDKRGVWRTDGKKFSNTFTGIRWVLISFVPQNICPRRVLKRLVDDIVQTSTSIGLHLNDPMAIESYGREIKTYDALCYAMRKNVKFVFVVISRNDNFHSYDELKFIADTKLGLITQCMEQAVAVKCSQVPAGGQIIKNLVTKLNVKLGGTNHTFSREPTIPMKGTMIMGADAAHSPRGSRCPSIAAVVGSIDHVPFQYAVSCKVQKNPNESKLSQEIILGMKEMTKDILKRYVKANSCSPERIVLFRDGVSEGQFETVLRAELSLIQEACYEACGQILPITFIVVQKGHQTRFVPRDPKDGIGQTGNIPPGTIVDADVTHPAFFDYFLCSHEGLKGTSKPTHYVVLHDDSGFQADDLQKFCYDLCHLYGKCNRSISIPAPTMNAHLAAARAKKYIDWCISGANRSDSPSGNFGSSVENAIEVVNKVSWIEAPMFFI